MKFFITSFLILVSKCFISQTFTYSNECKAIGDTKPNLWKSSIEITDNGMVFCDTLDQANVCKSTKVNYKYSLRNDTIFMSYQNKDGIINISPQYSLMKSDTISFLQENAKGFTSDVIGGWIHFIGEEKISINRINYLCYVFEKNQRKRNYDKKIGYIEQQKIYLDKNLLIPVVIYTKFLNPFKAKKYKSAYGIRRIIEIK